MKTLIALALVFTLGCAGLPMPTLPIIGGAEPTLTTEQLAVIIVALTSDDLDLTETDIIAALLPALGESSQLALLAQLADYESLTPAQRVTLISQILALLQGGEV